LTSAPIYEVFFGENMKFADFVCFKAIVPKLDSTERDDVIAELVASLDKAGCIGKGDCRRITGAIINRENEASTGMGKGVAIPHVKDSAFNNVVAVVGQSARGIDFSALDKQLVYSIILLISPTEQPDKHLQVMEKIFRHLQQDKFRNFLRQAQTKAQIEELLKEADENPLW